MRPGVILCRFILGLSNAEIPNLIIRVLIDLSVERKKEGLCLKPQEPL